MSTATSSSATAGTIDAPTGGLPRGSHARSGSPVFQASRLRAFRVPVLRTPRMTAARLVTSGLLTPRVLRAFRTTRYGAGATASLHRPSLPGARCGLRPAAGCVHHGLEPAWPPRAGWPQSPGQSGAPGASAERPAPVRLRRGQGVVRGALVRCPRPTPRPGPCPALPAGRDRHPAPGPAGALGPAAAPDFDAWMRSVARCTDRTTACPARCTPGSSWLSSRSVTISAGDSTPRRS